MRFCSRTAALWLWIIAADTCRLFFVVLAADDGLTVRPSFSSGDSQGIPVEEEDEQRVIMCPKENSQGRIFSLLGSSAQTHVQLANGCLAVSLPSDQVASLSSNPDIESVADDPRRYLLRSASTSATVRPSRSAAVVPPRSSLDDEPREEEPQLQLQRRLTDTVPYGISAVQADQVGPGSDGSQITVCIIDSGYDIGHEDLPSTSSRVTSSSDPATGDPFNDQDGHGTHVAGTIVALGGNQKGVVGVNPNDNLRLHIVKVFGTTGSWAYSSDLIHAINECESASSGGRLIVSMSLGGSSDSSYEENELKLANDRGVLLVAAAGNDGSSKFAYPASYDSVLSIAAVDSDNAIAPFSQTNSQVELAGPGVSVKSTVPMGQGRDESLLVGDAAFEAAALEGSPTGTTTGNLFVCNAVDGLGSPGDCAGATGKVCLLRRGDLLFYEKVLECQNQGGIGAVIYNNEPSLFTGTLLDEDTAILSMGVSGDIGDQLLGEYVNETATLITGVGNYAYYDGTSMATPHVSGVAALVWSHDSTCTNKEIRKLLRDTALDLSGRGRDDTFGYGLVQAADAVATMDCQGINPDDDDTGNGDGNGGGGGGSLGEGICFSGEMTVSVLGKGRVSLRSLNVHDKVFTGNSADGRPVYQPVYSFGHLDHKSPVEYIRIYHSKTGKGKEDSIEISAAHLIFLEGSPNSPVRADTVKKGDVLWITKMGDKTERSVVTKLQKVQRVGAYLPLTPDGTIIVNDVAASAYVSIRHDAPSIVEKFDIISQQALFHWWMSPYRIVCMGLSSKLCEDDYNDDGIIHWLILGRDIAKFGETCNHVVQRIGISVVVLLLGLSMTFEALGTFGVVFLLSGGIAVQVWFGRKKRLLLATSKL